METKAHESDSINRINEALPGGYKIAVVTFDQLELLEKNARYMKNETFQNLVNNIKADGALSQLPFCYLQENGKYKVLSGNHRTQAAQKAGLTEIPVMYTDQELTHGEQVKIQLSHNSISGEDNPFILAELYNEIEDLDDKYYAGLDDKMLEQLENVSIEGLTEAQLDYLMITFLFLPEEEQNLKETIDKARNELSSDAISARMTEYDKILDSQSKVQSAYNLHNGATALMIIMDIFERNIGDLKKGWLDEETEEPLHNGWVPISSVFEKENIPAESAVVINKAIDKMQKEGEVDTNNRWQMLEYLAADYLAGE